MMMNVNDFGYSGIGREFGMGRVSECSGEFAVEIGTREREWSYGGMFDAVFWHVS